MSCQNCWGEKTSRVSRVTKKTRRVPCQIDDRSRHHPSPSIGSTSPSLSCTLTPCHLAPSSRHFDRSCQPSRTSVRPGHLSAVHLLPTRALNHPQQLSIAQLNVRLIFNSRLSIAHLNHLALHVILKAFLPFNPTFTSILQDFQPFISAISTFTPS